MERKKCKECIMSPFDECFLLQLDPRPQPISSNFNVHVPAACHSSKRCPMSMLSSEPKTIKLSI